MPRTIHPFGTYMSIRHDIMTARAVRKLESAKGILNEPLRDAHLENWFQNEAKRRLSALPHDVIGKARQDALEMGNRFNDGSMEPISLDQLLKMKDFCDSPKNILDRAKQGVELLKNNDTSHELSTAARGIPLGGASSRASKWAAKNPEHAKLFGFDETTPRALYRMGGVALFQHITNFSAFIARSIGKISPIIAMTNSETVDKFISIVRNEFGNYTDDELNNMIFFNQVVLPRIWVNDGEVIGDKLYPAGHGDYPYLIARYSMAKTLQDYGIKYLFFSNQDEWLWQPDPVMISIAQELFDKGHHMAIIGVENTNNQFGGGFVRNSDGIQSLVETPRLPWEIVKGGKAPIALNTTFYVLDVEFLAGNEDKLLNVKKSLIVKEVPGRVNGEIDQILGVDSWAGDVFAEVTNPAFIKWPRLNFLGIKDGSFIAGVEKQEFLGGRTYAHYLQETIATYPQLMHGLINGENWAAEFLHRTGYSYLEPGIN